MFFIITERLWKIFSKKFVHFVQKPRKFLWLLLNIFFYAEDPRKFQTGSINTIELPWDMVPYPRQSFLISFFSLFWCPASIKDVFHNHWKVMKIFIQSVYILWRNRATASERKCADQFVIFKPLSYCFKETIWKFPWNLEKILF